MKKITALLLTSLFLLPTTSIATTPIIKGDIKIEEVKVDCDEFRPNLITKFIWREGPTRALLYKKCLDQHADDEKFNKYDDLIKGNKFSDLNTDVNKIKTRLTFFTLANAIKVYVSSDNLNEQSLRNIKKSLVNFKKHYQIMKKDLDQEIIYLKKKEKINSIHSKELMDIVIDSEDELDKKIEQTLKYIDFVLKDYNNYIEIHNKFFPKIYIEPNLFKNSTLTKRECDFLTLNFEEDWKYVRNKFNFKCNKLEIKK